ncbi:MAG TPA: penicillin-binding transpeptidase domain-containing protein, partial [Coriobacteriia bacterium]|nr:penicillin-binding transpeptidase domain-containing protein [Coriobacteriia bacterium]
ADVPAHPRPKRRALSAEASAVTRDLLVAAVTNGTGGAAAVEGYEVAGKTGTAQKPREDGRGYAGGGYIGSFVGFVPADDPRILIVVTIDEPRNAIYGGVVAAPAFAEIAAFSLSHLMVPPTPSQ